MTPPCPASAPSPSCAPPPPTSRPQLIIHGGAGNITRAGLPPALYQEYRRFLLDLLATTAHDLATGASALDAATAAVAALEDCPLFNCGRGAVFTRAGTIELEASVMVSRGFAKRGAAASLLRTVKHPVRLVRELLVRGDGDLAGRRGDASALGHVHVSGAEAERLADEWGVERVDEGWFRTKKRWQQHLDDLKRDKPGNESEETAPPSWAQLVGEEDGSNDDEPDWHGEYLPQGTVGCVAMDRDGVICAATSTGGLTNKLPGRIGDTPTFGAGFWAEEWEVSARVESADGAERAALSPSRTSKASSAPFLSPLGRMLPASARSALADCLPGIAGYAGLATSEDNDNDDDCAYSTEKTRPFNDDDEEPRPPNRRYRRGVGLSGTGNGDSFLRLAAAHSAALIPRFSPLMTLQDAVKLVAGPGGYLQQSAGDRWRNGTFEGEGGLIGIEVVDGEGTAVADFNCGGMFRAWLDAAGAGRMRVFRGDYHDEPE